MAGLAARLPAGTAARGEADLERRVAALAVALGRGARALVWGGDCLPRALVLWTWLRRAGEAPSLELGVRRDGGMRSHAWVTWRGRAIGEPEDVDARYVSFSAAMPRSR